MHIDDLSPPKGEAIDLKAPGEKFDGIVEHVGELRTITGKFGTQEKWPITLMIGGEPRTHWLPKGSREATVIADAIRAAGANSLLKGGRLQVVRIEDVPTNKGNAMKDYAAKYTPPSSSSGGIGADDLFD